MSNQGKAKLFDPYRNFRFKVKIDGQVVAGFSKMNVLKKITEGTNWVEAGDNRNFRCLPSKTKYEPVTLEKGITDDKIFEEWSTLVNKSTDNATKAGKLQKDIQIMICDLNGTPELTYNIYNCWVSEFQAVPDMDATQNSVAIQTIKFENEGFAIDA